MRLRRVILLVVLFICCSCELLVDMSQEEYQLRNLYKSTYGEMWNNNTNWYGYRPISEWYGIITDDNGRVTEIDLSNNNLQWSFELDLDYFTSLKKVDISGNVKLQNVSMWSEAYVLPELIMNNLIIDNWQAAIKFVKDLYVKQTKVSGWNFSNIESVDVQVCEFKNVALNQAQNILVDHSDFQSVHFSNIANVIISYSELNDCRFYYSGYIEIRDSRIYGRPEFLGCSKIRFENVELIIDDKSYFCVHGTYNGGEDIFESITR